MARIRTVKPEVGKHSGLYDLELELGLPVRFAWVMLFTVCDREGRFKWKPRDLKVDILPHDDLDFSRVLDAWVTRGFLVKYRVGHAWFGWLHTFRKHQVINHRESASALPAPEDAEEIIDMRNQEVAHASGTRDPREDHAARGEGKGREGKGREGKKDISGKNENRFKPPSPDEVGEYMLEIGYQGNPQQFHDYYSSKGWMIGKNKMKDWKAAVRTWRANNARYGTGTGATGSRAEKGKLQNASPDNSEKPAGYFAGDFISHADEW